MSARVHAPPRATAAPAVHSAMADLLAHYLAGHIADPQWAGMSDAFDAIEASGHEREAYAAFYLDAGPASGVVSVPTAEEAAAMLDMIRR